MRPTMSPTTKPKTIPNTPPSAYPITPTTRPTTKPTNIAASLRENALHGDRGGMGPNKTKANRPAANSGHEKEGPYRRVRLSAWLGRTLLGQPPICTGENELGEGNTLHIHEV